MTAAAIAPPRPAAPPADRALKTAARTWFAVTIAGQAVFLYYIAAFYGPSTLTGNFQAWARNTMLINGYIAGDTRGNLAFGAHVLLAAVITFGGTLQLIPWIRARVPALHRWTGRAFLTAAIGASLAGLYMTWGRDTTTPLTNKIAISLDGLLILGFAALAWRNARARDFASHRRWALRTFMAANGVWFLRLGFASWGILMTAVGGPEITLKDPFFVFWNFGCYLVPLAALELYLRAQQSRAPGQWAMAAGLFLLTGLTALGVVGSWFGFFAPVLAHL